MFLPWLFSLQPSEKLFCVTPTFSAIVNFSLLEIQQRVHKIEFVNRCVSELSNTFTFSREMKVEQSSCHENNAGENRFLTDNEIEICINEALKAAQDTCKNFNMEPSKEAWTNIHNLKGYKNYESNEGEDDDLDKDKYEISESDYHELKLGCDIYEQGQKENEILKYIIESSESDNQNEGLYSLKNFKTLNIQDYPQTDTNSKSVIKVNINGNVKILRKSTLC